MADLKRGQGVALQEREGRARHGDRLAGQRMDHRARELALAGPQIALEQDDTARLQMTRDPGRQGLGRGEVGQEQAALGPLHALGLSSGSARA